VHCDAVRKPGIALKAGILVALKRKFEHRVVFLALAMLLIAQLGAQLHTYAHGNTGAYAPTPTLLASHGACDDCLAFAPLLSAAGAPARLPRLAGQACTPAPPLRAHSLLNSALILAFRSRAPPLALPA
jgi:hypothetical protein